MKLEKSSIKLLTRTKFIIGTYRPDNKFSIAYKFFSSVRVRKLHRCEKQKIAIEDLDMYSDNIPLVLMKEHPACGLRLKHIGRKRLVYKDNLVLP